MSDYDLALDIDPNNFLGHYNRGLLRAQVGDDNRAIEDFDFVLKMEPDNMMATFNRGLLREMCIRDSFHPPPVSPYPSAFALWWKQSEKVEANLASTCLKRLSFVVTICLLA